jgi:hypothetical protein
VNARYALYGEVLCYKELYPFRIRGGGNSMHLAQRILVTGGAGFLGSHLCERMLATGANVICLDN